MAISRVYHSHSGGYLYQFLWVADPVDALMVWDYFHGPRPRGYRKLDRVDECIPHDVVNCLEHRAVWDSAWNIDYEGCITNLGECGGDVLVSGSFARPVKFGEHPPFFRVKVKTFIKKRRSMFLRRLYVFSDNQYKSFACIYEQFRIQ